jgi:hypothetical protein
MIQHKRRSISRKTTNLLVVVLSIAFVILAVMIYFYSQPLVEREWRLDTIKVFFRALVHPIREIPTPAGEHSSITTIEGITPTQAGQTDSAPPDITSTELPASTPIPLPVTAQLPAPPFEGEGVNNCGAATLSMLLTYYNWSGDQYMISTVIKPVFEDRNVNMEELAFYVREYKPELQVVYRSGGDDSLLRGFIAAGFPVIVETGLAISEAFWVNDDMWAGHYLLVTGYDDENGVFTIQDSYLGPNRTVAYADLNKNWQAFNYIYMVVYPTENESQILGVMGNAWNVDSSIQNALRISLEETAATPGNAFAWFNLGSNLVQAGRYDEAVTAFDKARTIGFPQRMLRYQFTPFEAYFHAYQMDDVLALTEYALTVTPDSEEALLWRGWAYYRLGNRNGALDLMRQALEARPGFQEAEEALQYIETH